METKKNELVQNLLIANKMYREGSPIMSDQAFDDMLDAYKSLVSNEEYERFVSLLTERGGKAIHPYIMGSLEKLKFSEPQEISSFLLSNIPSGKLSVTAKVDGISCRIHYTDGNIVSASTRGNGSQGEDISVQMMFFKNVPHKIKLLGEVDIRGELVIKRDVFNKKYSERFANTRNTVAGFINKIKSESSELNDISFIAYEVMGGTLSKQEQLSILDDNGFEVVWRKIYQVKGCDVDSIINNLSIDAQNDFEYDTDGLVVSDVEYKAELDRYRPVSQRALKLNIQSADTVLEDIEWALPSKNGRIVPVGLLKPVSLGGTVVSRVTLNNWENVSSLKLRKGAIVKVVRRGDVIPHLEEVVSNPDECDLFDYPRICPSCGEPTFLVGLDVVCKNENCLHQKINAVAQFIKKLDVKNASVSTLENFGITDFDKLLSFVPNDKYKSQVNLYKELQEKMFTRSEKDLLSMMNYNGISEILCRRILDFYALDTIKQSIHLGEDVYCKLISMGLPFGVGEAFLKRFCDSIEDNIAIVDKIVSDNRYNLIEVEENADIENRGSVCFTGALEKYKRSEIEKLARKSGFDVKSSVGKELDFLVCNEVNSTSSKMKKAKEFEIKVITEEEFLIMIGIGD